MQYLCEEVGEAADGTPLRHVLRTQLRLPHGFIAHLKFIPGGILLNGAAAHVDACVRRGDAVAVRIDDVGAGNPFLPEDTPLVRLVWEDEYLAVVAKSAGIAVHGAGGENRPAVANWAAYRWGAEQPFHPVNRLDRGTSGLMCLAKCGLIHDRLRRGLHTEGLERIYLAVCEGQMPPGTGVIDAPIGRLGGTTARRGISAEGKASVTEYECLWSGENISLLRVRLRTGRTHQIRIHLASLGHPLCGDPLYGGGTELTRPALHSARLSLEHPVSGQRQVFQEELPEDISRLLAEKSCYFGRNVLK